MYIDVSESMLTCFTRDLCFQNRPLPKRIMTPPPIVCTTRKHGSLQGYHLEAESWRMLIAVQKSWQGRHTMSQKYIEYEGSEVVLPTSCFETSNGYTRLPQNQNSKIQTPKIKTPRSKPPKSKLQDPNPQNQNSKIQNQNSKIQTPKIKTPESKSNSKIKTYINFWFMTGPQKKMTNIFLANHQHNEQNIKMEITKKIWQLIFSLKIHETGKMNEKKFARVSLDS